MHIRAPPSQAMISRTSVRSAASVVVPTESIKVKGIQEQRSEPLQLLRLDGQLERLVDVGEQVLDVLQTDAHPDEVWRQAGCLALVVRQR